MKVQIKKIEGAFKNALDKLESKANHQSNNDEIISQLKRFFNRYGKMRNKYISASAKGVLRLLKTDRFEPNRMIDRLQFRLQKLAGSSEAVLPTNIGPLIYTKTKRQYSLALIAAIIFIRNAFKLNDESEKEIIALEKLPFYKKTIEKNFGKLLLNNIDNLSYEAKKQHLLNYLKKHKKSAYANKEKHMQILIENISRAKTETDIYTFLQEKQAELRELKKSIYIESENGPVVVSNKPIFKYSIYLNSAFDFVKSAFKIEPVIEKEKSQKEALNEINLRLPGEAFDIHPSELIPYTDDSLFAKNDTEIDIQAKLKSLNSMLSMKCKHTNSKGILMMQAKLNDLLKQNIWDDVIVMQCLADICFIATQRLQRRMSQFSFTCLMPGRHKNIDALYNILKMQQYVDYQNLSGSQKKVTASLLLEKLDRVKKLLESDRPFTFQQDKKYQAKNDSVFLKFDPH